MDNKSTEQNCLCWKGGFWVLFLFVCGVLFLSLSMSFPSLSFWQLNCTCRTMSSFFFPWQFSCYTSRSANQLLNTPLNGMLDRWLHCDGKCCSKSYSLYHVQKSELQGLQTNACCVVILIWPHREVPGCCNVFVLFLAENGIVFLNFTGRRKWLSKAPGLSKLVNDLKL